MVSLFLIHRIGTYVTSGDIVSVLNVYGNIWDAMAQDANVASVLCDTCNDNNYSIDSINY